MVTSSPPFQPSSTFPLSISPPSTKVRRLSTSNAVLSSRSTANGIRDGNPLFPILQLLTSYRTDILVTHSGSSILPAPLNPPAISRRNSCALPCVFIIRCILPRIFPFFSLRFFFPVLFRSLLVERRSGDTFLLVLVLDVERSRELDTTYSRSMMLFIYMREHKGLMLVAMIVYAWE